MSNNYLTQAPTLIPYLTVASAKNSIRFYEQAFGFEWLNTKEVDPTGNLDHAEMKYKDLLIMFASEGAFGSMTKTPAHLNVEPAITLYIYCDDVDAMYQKALSQGAKSQMEPNDAFWGDRVCKVSDPDGHEWMFARKL